jgi:DNA modification methylase
MIIKSIDINLIKTNTGQIAGLPANPRTINKDNFAKLKQSIVDNPEMLQLRELIVYPHNNDYVVIGGNMRLEAMKSLGYSECVCKVLDENTSIDNLRAYLIKDNTTGGDWDFDMLANDWELDLLNSWGVDIPQLNVELDTTNKYENYEKDVLSKRFGHAPFSVLDTRKGWWLDRKKSLTNLIGNSRQGRDKNLISDSPMMAGYNEGTSTFDPVLAELLVEWFCAKNGLIIDPFAGGCVRGVISCLKGRNYVGVDIRQEQVDENRIMAEKIELENNPVYICGDSCNIDRLVEKQKFDFILSCPPYHDLEVYSDNPNDISNMTYDEFINSYATIIKKSIELLNDDCFIGWVVGDIRDKAGNYKLFTNKTIKIFIENGCYLYNDIILLNNIGTKGITATKQFNGGRKVAKIHQNVLVFLKGDFKKAVAKLDDCLFEDFEDNDESHEFN